MLCGQGMCFLHCVRDATVLAEWCTELQEVCNGHPVVARPAHLGQRRRSVEAKQTALPVSAGVSVLLYVCPRQAVAWRLSFRHPRRTLDVSLVRKIMARQARPPQRCATGS